MYTMPWQRLANAAAAATANRRSTRLFWPAGRKRPNLHIKIPGWIAVERYDPSNERWDRKTTVETPQATTEVK